MNKRQGMPLMAIDTALETVLASVEPVTGTESVSLDAIAGRVLVQDCKATISVPPHNNSAMDGYAVHANAVRSVPVNLAVTQRIAAGTTGKPLAANEAARIFTGAPLPDGADAVVMQENCKALGGQVTVLQAVTTGENVRNMGDDIEAGARVLSAGHRLRPQDAGTLASIGIQSAQVRRRLKVALITTGDELVRPGSALKPGQIYNSNFYTLAAMLQALGCEVLDFGVVADDLDSTAKALLAAAADADCVISTGGVSVGEEDHVKAAVEANGRLELWKLAIKPGKPLACGKIHGRDKETQFFGLPGNPVSAFVTFCLVVRPSLLKMLGCTHIATRYYRVAAGFTCPQSGERQEYLRVKMAQTGHEPASLQAIENQSSGVGTSLSSADGLAIIPPYTSVAIGDSLEFIPFSEVLN